MNNDFNSIFDVIPAGADSDTIHAHELVNGFYLGKAAGCPILLIPQDTRFFLDVDYRLSHIEISTAENTTVKTKNKTSNANFIIIKCISQDAVIQKWLLAVMEIFYLQIIDELNANKFKELITSLVDLVRALDAVPKSTIVGLLGELVLILNSNNTGSAIDSWHKHSSSRIDFTFQNYKIEVKTASVSNRKHVIKQNQIKIVKDEKLYIASVLIEQSDSGKNIYDIVQEIQSKIPKESIQSKKLMSQVTDLVGNKLVECTNYRIDIRSALNSIQFYDANDIPIIEESYISPLLSNLSYEIDFSKLNAIDTKEILFI